MNLRTSIFFYLAGLFAGKQVPVKNYDGSWTEWSYFENLPFETNNINSNKL